MGGKYKQELRGLFYLGIKCYTQLGMVTHAFNPNTWKASGSLVSDKPGPHKHSKPLLKKESYIQINGTAG